MRPFMQNFIGTTTVTKINFFCQVFVYSKESRGLLKNSIFQYFRLCHSFIQSLPDVVEHSFSKFICQPFF